MHLSKIFPSLFVDIKLLWRYFYRTGAEQAKSHATSCYECYGLKKLQKCVLPTAFASHRFTLHQRNTSYPNVSPPLRNCVCPNSKQAQGPLRSHNILSPPKSITFPSILTYFIQIWIEFLKLFIQIVRCNYFLDPTTYTLLGGSNI